MAAIVDIHCHTFNGDDLPVRGFVRRVGGTKTSLVKLIDKIIDDRVQGSAPGYEEELEEISKRLDPHVMTRESVFIESDLDQEVADVLAQLERDDEQLVMSAQDELLEEAVGLAPAGHAVQEGVFDLVGALKRYIKWALLFAKPRVRLTEILAGTYPGVDLFVPMLVDLEYGLEDVAETDIDQQLDMQARISKVSMLGKLWDAPSTRVHPFVGFDPRRPDAFEIVQRAVLEFGFIGVKLYPPMGFKPIGNAESPCPKGMGAEEAQAADDALRRLYDFCVALQVPITAHGNPTNYADDDYETFSSPRYWGAVLTEFPELHLNLGHFGGSGTGAYSIWPEQIANLSTFPYLFADIGNHRLESIDVYLTQIEEMYGDPATAEMRHRLMFGTDWFMVANQADFGRFLVEFRRKYGDRFPDDRYPGAVERFMGGAALSFLGFDDPTNRNTRRVADLYLSLGLASPDWLAAT